MAWGTVELEPEVRDWLEGLSNTLFARAAFYVDLLADRGPLLDEPYTRQLDGQLSELRFYQGRSATRITYWIAPARTVKSIARDERRMSEPGAAEEYDATRLAYELGVAVRELRERHGWSQTQLAHAAGMTQSAVARFEAGGTVPTLPVLERLAHALDVDLAVQFKPRTSAA